jgi:hypothetical protein
MWKIELQPHQILRRRSFGMAQIALCILVFGLTASAVCYWGAMNWTPSDSGPALVAAAQDLAERQAGERREAWQRDAEESCQKARQSVEEARREHEKSTAQLEACHRQMREAAEAVKKKQKLAEMAEKQLAAARAQAAARQQEKPKLPQIANPAWLELDRKLADLKLNRDQLLVDRTPLHPIVREVQDDMDEVQRQMDAIPRQIPDPKAKSTAKVEPLKPSNHPDGSTQKAAELALKEQAANELAAKANRQKLSELTAAVEKARQAMEKAEISEQQAAQARENEPQFAVEPAQVVIPPQEVDQGWKRLLWTTLMASVLMTAGVGSWSFGRTIEPPVASLAEVHADLDVPIVGLISAGDTLPSPEAIERQWRMRHTSIAVGLVLMAACPVVAVLGVVGM